MSNTFTLTYFNDDKTASQWANSDGNDFIIWYRGSTETTPPNPGPSIENNNEYYINSNITELNDTTNVSIVNDNSTDKYIFNSTVNNDGTINNNLNYINKYLISLGTYYFNNIPQTHPLAILTDSDTIEYYGIDANGTQSNANMTTQLVLGVTRNFYSGNIKVIVKKSFWEISIYCLNHGYMGGENILRCKYPEYLNDNTSVTIINDNGTNKYIFNNNASYKEKYLISLGTYYINNIPQTHPLAILIDSNTIEYYGIDANGNQSNTNLTTSQVSGVNRNFYSGNIKVIVKKSFWEASIYCLNHGFMGGQNILRYNYKYKTTYFNSYKDSNLSQLNWALRDGINFVAWFKGLSANSPFLNKPSLDDTTASDRVIYPQSLSNGTSNQRYPLKIYSFPLNDTNEVKNIFMLEFKSNVNNLLASHIASTVTPTNSNQTNVLLIGNSTEIMSLTNSSSIGQSDLAKTFILQGTNTIPGANNSTDDIYSYPYNKTWFIVNNNQLSPHFSTINRTSNGTNNDVTNSIKIAELVFSNTENSGTIKYCYGENDLASEGLTDTYSSGGMNNLKYQQQYSFNITNGYIS